MKQEYRITEDALINMTGLSPRSVRAKFRRFLVGGRDYSYIKIAEDAIKEKYSNKDKQVFIDRETFARILGVTEKTIQTYANKKILIEEIDGTYDLIPNFERYNKENSEYNKILKVKREREEVRKRRELLQLDIDEGKYIPMELYGLILKDTVVSFRQELLRTATYLSINLKTEPQSQWKKYIQKTLGDTLTNFSKLSEEVEEKIIAKIRNEYET
ncbi:hypothetical protein [Cetobacterium sp.]|uniref:hypothetical protein n=1 Tax=Cetobacterium sp. TaxID=2071632 RepID=UPI003F31E1CF